MATVSINDLKIRLLQLKGIGYDKLLLHKKLVNQLDVTNQELNAISNEIESLTKLILDANNTALSEQESKKIETSPVINEKVSHIDVDPNQLQTILSPNASLGKTEVPKTKKTEHIIGRRTS